MKFENFTDRNREFENKIIQLQLEKKNAIKMADEANNANMTKNHFLANMSHEIRTPLNSIVGFSELLSSTSLDIEQKKYVKNIINSSETLLTLINDILDLSKIDAGKLDLIPNNFN